MTDYTSMLVLNEEAYLAEGIDRKNQARLEAERAARQQAQYSYSPSYSGGSNYRSRDYSRGGSSFGGGALSPVEAVLCLLAALSTLGAKRRIR